MIIKEIRQRLESSVDSKKQREKTGFKEKPQEYGVKYAVVRKISRDFFAKVKSLSNKEVFSLCQDLLKSNYQEESVIAFDWVFRLKKEYQESDFEVFEKWLKRYVNNWAKCDDFCCHAFGEFILQFPEFLPHIKKQWTVSKNRWLRRAAAVILIILIRKDKRFLKDVFEIADKLLLDSDDLVQKGYGWMLKEVSHSHQKAVFDYVMRNKNVMPRTALRYAIEKMPKNLKKQVMVV